MMGTENEGAFLSFVTRSVIGGIETTVQVNKAPKGKPPEYVDQKVMLEDAVIVFMPNGQSVLVMSTKEAARQGFLERPEVVNIDQVTSTSSLAGQLKFGFTNEEKIQAWYDMEQEVINRATVRGGLPLPPNVYYSKDSMIMPKQKELT